MSNSSKVETSIEIKSEANRFHEFFARTPYEICNISPDKVPSHKLLEGEWGKVGCVFLWDYIEGKCGSKIVLLLYMSTCFFVDEASN